MACGAVEADRDLIHWFRRAGTDRLSGRGCWASVFRFISHTYLYFRCVSFGNGLYFERVDDFPQFEEPLALILILSRYLQG